MNLHEFIILIIFLIRTSKYNEIQMILLIGTSGYNIRYISEYILKLQIHKYELNIYYDFCKQSAHDLDRLNI